MARPTDRLAEVAAMYERGLGLQVLARFVDHDGFDGVVLGHADQPWHLEFTQQRGQVVGGAPNAEHLLVFYLPDVGEWRRACERALLAGFVAVAAHNPYWDRQGRVFRDLDGYHVVLQNAAWPPSS